MIRKYYDDESELSLQRDIEDAEHKLRELQLRKQIADIAHQIKALEAFRAVYPPLKAAKTSLRLLCFWIADSSYLVSVWRL